MDLAIAINDWCGAAVGSEDGRPSAEALLQGYQQVRALESEELSALPIARVIAAARLLCSRLGTRDERGRFRKDPKEYATLLSQLIQA